MSTSIAEQGFSWYRGFIQGKTRISLAWAFVFILGWFARDYPTWPGIFLCGLGATLRFWASGYIRKDSRLAIGGPYAFIRNPLYFGTYLMALGTILAIENRVLFWGTSVIFASIYHFIILDEETKLQRIFRGDYSNYCRFVPRFFPRVWPPFWPASQRELGQLNPGAPPPRFSLDVAVKNKAYEAYLSFLGLIGFVFLTAFLWKQI